MRGVAIFAGVGEALASHADPGPACTAAGRALAEDGVGLGEALARLRATYAAVTSALPDLAAVEALSVAWGESVLALVQRRSCEDPLTGLAGVPHLVSRLHEVERSAAAAGTQVSLTHALVVVEAPAPEGHPFTGSLRVLRVAECARAVFAGCETVVRLGPARLVVLAERQKSLEGTCAILGELLDDLGIRNRVWVEGLPHEQRATTLLLAELSRA